METARLGSSLDLAVVAVYLFGIMGFGALFARHTRSTRDFFMSGQRFSAWLITASCIATLVGSYSFMKYSEAGFKYGLSSTSTYMNDWFIMGLFMFGWLPLIYFNRVVSVPEYFEKRFGRSVRVAGTIIILLYMTGYIGYNLYTVGVALSPILGMGVMTIVMLTAVFCGVYVTAGGQTSVIMTDLAQGILLLVVGLGVLFLGIAHVGGFEAFWDALPASHRFGMADFNKPASFNAVGLFWQDGMANSFAFYFMNQGILLRFLSAKSPAEGRKAALWIVLLLMPITAVAVSGAGWVGAAMKSLGMLPESTRANAIFITVSEILCSKGFFGLVLAALTAALMSTVDTLINAVSAVSVNDIYRPYLKRGASDRHYLRAARVISVAAAGVGVALVPLFMTFGSLYAAHAAFTAAITPPLVVVILLGCLWPRFDGRAALLTIIAGSAAIVASFWWPEALLGWLSHGMSGTGGFKFIRALYGLVVCAAIAASSAWWLPARAGRRTEGLTIWSLQTARDLFKGRANASEHRTKPIRLAIDLEPGAGTDALLHPTDLTLMKAADGDLVYISDPRWWLGGLHSLHTRARADASVPRGCVALSAENLVEGRLRAEGGVSIERVL